MPSFPGAIKSFTTKNSGDVVQASHINDLQDEVNAIEAGYVSGTAPLNSSKSTVAALSVSGGSTLAGALNVGGGSTLASLDVDGNSTFASSITIGSLPMIFPASGGSTGQALVIDSTSGSTMTLAWKAPSAVALQLLHASTGTDVNAAAATVASCTLSGLTVEDTLQIEFLIGSDTAATAAPIGAYHVEDGVFLADFTTGNNLSSATKAMGTSKIKNYQANSTVVRSVTMDVRTFSGASALEGNGMAPNVATAWTGSWTLGLRHSGVTATGTFKWGWSVYKVAGQ